MWKIFVGNVAARIKERELADEFSAYGLVRSVWVARNPPGYAFVELDRREEAERAISALDGKHGWRVEMSKDLGRTHNSSNNRCQGCGSSRHHTRECKSGASRRPYGRFSSPRSSSLTNRQNFLGRHRRSRSPRHGYSYNDRVDPPRKRERSISPELACVKISCTYEDSSPAKENSNVSDALPAHDNCRSSNCDKAEERLKNEYPQNNQDSSIADDNDVIKEHESNKSPEHYFSSSQDDDESEDECDVPRRNRYHNRSRKHNRIKSQNEEDNFQADEKKEGSRSPEHECYKSPQYKEDGSCANGLSPAGEEHSSGTSPQLESSPEC